MIQEIIKQYSNLIKTRNYQKLEEAMKSESYDLSNPEEIISLQKELIKQNPEGLLEINLALLEAYLSKQPDRSAAYDAFRKAARTALKSNDFPKKAELSLVCLD